MGFACSCHQCLKNPWGFDAFNQFISDIGAFNAQKAFLSATVTQKIDAAIPHHFLIHYGKFLMDIGFKYDIYTGAF